MARRDFALADVAMTNRQPVYPVFENRSLMNLILFSPAFLNSLIRGFRKYASQALVPFHKVNTKLSKLAQRRFMVFSICNIPFDSII